MIEEILEFSKKNMINQNFDCLAVGVIDFDRDSFESFQLTSNEIYEDSKLYFDLASLTKPLTFGLAYLAHEKDFNNDIRLLIEHRSGLPRWGRLSNNGWKEQIQNYSIKESETLYSDYGALRAQIEMEKIIGKSLYDVVSNYHDDEVIHWLDLNFQVSPITGFRNRSLIFGQVNDDNAFVINQKVCHAGLFGTIEGVCKTLINAQKELDLISKIGVDHSNRYYKGWDTVEDIQDTLAGIGCSKNTFGHLGFTGTSIWIDPEKRRGHVILTNETRKFWYHRKNLQVLRKGIGEIVFSK